ncbi:MAG: hypothetical protein HOE75_12785 [Chloroflexi bacterium]|jgi:hypothetical protein|nr:hypothetical protein [Chloroflexota bacterium]
MITTTTTNDPVAVVDALEQGFSHRMIAVEFGIDITTVEAIAERRRPFAPAPMVGLLLLDARQQMIEGGSR